MIVAGIMSGTSADGINVAIVRLEDHDFETKLDFVLHKEFPFPANVRKFILSVMNAEAKVADLARLNVLLGELYAEAFAKTASEAQAGVSVIGCHGQTIYHQGEKKNFLGRPIAATWQTGEGAVLAARTGIPVVSDFRQADMAAGGKGAPLVPFLDYMLYRHPQRGRIVQNIGGIANLSAIPAGTGAGSGPRPERVIAFDTGPGNMVIDGVMERLFHRPFDENGKVAAKGTILESVLKKLMRASFFRTSPPKTAGREEFGREYVEQFVRACGKAKREDVVATATALTARTISAAIRDFLPISLHDSHGYKDMIVSGGGSRNCTLVQMLRELLPELEIKTSDAYGLPSEAKEAVAFAVLAYQTWHRAPSSIPSATGADYPAVLGKISYP
ncbi:MAG TPA: anhydro-N-acetylmuramic acid kinase [Terriglobales bacterium]|nr:anhydro-N-acetylmuramic acid kinase [Terriglobales bacterium]